ncbi:MAG: TfoX/Sxy family protein [Rhizobiales bacterium]|nr:TfoX/Sxy family protein [Hyphomicrobiales bacterium]NRB12940.1 TfoX/Sxy family protein [Hyphomicrobiales bacterium]
MATSPEYVDWIVDQLSDFAAVTTKRLFGGRAVLKDNLNFGLIFEDELYLKADAVNRDKFEQAGGEQFTYQKADNTIFVSFWTVPEGIIEDKEELAAWANDAFDAALRAKKPKSKRNKNTKLSAD